MAGIYVHIPFCRSRCIYCGFFSTTLPGRYQRYVDAIGREWQLRRGELTEPVRTIYIGGGTPSVLPMRQLDQLFRSLGDALTTAEEVTLECNPDDVTPDFAHALASLPVDRVSMGAQTFSDERLRFLRRRHTARQVGEAVSRLRQAGIGNVSLDLIYGFPSETLAEWHSDIDAALSLGPDHLSAYALSYEEGTPLSAMLQRGEVSEADEELSRQMYYDLIDRLAAAGFEHYEISNFARPQRRSRHNSAYWNHTPYVGLGAAAHSYDGLRRRQWNVSDVDAYMAGVESGALLTGHETLDEQSFYNDLLMTALRTCEGLSLSRLTPPQRDYCLAAARPFLADALLVRCDDALRLTRRGLFVSDMVIAELMMV